MTEPLANLLPAGFLNAVSLTPPGGSFKPIGNIMPVTLKGLVFKPAITLDLSACTLTQLTLQGCVGIHVIGGKWTPAAVKDQVLISRCTDVWFSGADLLGDGLAYGFRVVDSQDVQLIGNRVDRAFQGFNLGRVATFQVIANEVVGVNNDAILICDSRDGVIRQNVIGAPCRLDGRHPDGIQFLEKTLGANDNIEVSGNVITGASQGIFGGPVRNLKVKDNYVLIDHANAIRVSGAFIEMTGNTVATLPGAAHLANIIMDPAALTKRSGNVRRAWGRFAEQRD